MVPTGSTILLLGDLNGGEGGGLPAANTETNPLYPLYPLQNTNPSFLPSFKYLLIVQVQYSKYLKEGGRE
jgi:hypothetical protein